MFGPISSPSTSFLNLPQLFHDHQIRFFIHPVAKKYNRDFAPESGHPRGNFDGVAKTHQLLRCFNCSRHCGVPKYASFLDNCAPCIWRFLLSHSFLLLSYESINFGALPFLLNRSPKKSRLPCFNMKACNI